MSPTDPDDERAALLRRLLAGAPRPLLSRTAEQRLGARQREVLDNLQQMVLVEGISRFTIGELAARMGCSRRTLYELAPSKEQLQLLVLDRLMQHTGRQSLSAIDPSSRVVDQLRQYVTGGIDHAFRAAAYDDVADVPAARRLLDRHYGFAATVIERLLVLGVERGELHVGSPAVVAQMISASAQHFNDPDVLDATGLALGPALDAMFDALLGGLVVRRRAD